MDTKQRLASAMKAEIHEWMNDEICANSEQQLADRLARLAEQHFAGQVNPGAKHYERVMLTCAALEGIMVNVTEDGKTRLAAEFAEEAADYALERIGWREAHLTDEVYRLQSVLRQAREMAEEMRKKDTSDNLYVYGLAVRWLDYMQRQLSRHFGVQGKGDDDA